MEAALLSEVLKIAVGKLAPLLLDEFTSIMGVKKDLSDLRHLFEEITARLSTYSGQSFSWLKDLKDVAYDVDDLLNKVHLEAEKHRAGVDGDKHVMANWFCAKQKSGLSRLEMAREIKKIKKRFAKIVKQRTDINAIAEGVGVEHPVQHEKKTTGEMSILMKIDEAEVLGRDDIKDEIVSKLVNRDTLEKISIVSIVGLGGSGKTTLAKYICQDNKVAGHFDVTFWVHVSQEFKLEKLLGKLFESVSDEKMELHALKHMIKIISEKLSGKKFLLVLDDVWNEDPHDWRQFEQHFSRGAPGSKILLTTRDVKVARVVKSTDVVKLAFLSDDDSWKLFQQSLGWAKESLDSEFTEVGQEIVKKCGGVPLAITSLAGVLSDKPKITEWRTLRDSNLLDESDIKDRVSDCLKLSYLHLLDDLKQCFVLCSIFPKGSSMYKDHLTSQWIAHGFVNPVNGSRQPEDIASDFFDSLLKVSFLQDLVEDECTGRLICKMHDLVHDLSRQILQDELVLTPKKITADHDQRCRYLSLASCTENIDRKLFNKVRALYVNGGSFATDKPIKKGGCVRSVILEGLKDASFPMFALKFQYLGYLRISNVDCAELPSAISGCWNVQALHIIECREFEMLPESIGKLKRLRTLELSWATSLHSLPRSIGDCDSLESLLLRCCRELLVIPDSIAKNEKLRILDLGGCSKLVELPKGIRNLQRLEVLNLDGCNKLNGLPAGFGQLTRLQKLGLFVIGDSSEHARISELGNLDMISGVLEIKGIRYIKDLGDAEKAYLKKKKNIQKLKLGWNRSWIDGEGEVDMEKVPAVLNGLEPPSTIKELGIDDYQGLHLPCWMTKERHSSNSDSKFKQTVDLPYFSHLVKMTLNCFPRLKHLSGLVGFPLLETLMLSEFYALESISAGPFPSLTELSIVGMPHLLEFSTMTRIALADEDGVTECGNQKPQCCFPRLSALSIENCPKWTGPSSCSGWELRRHLTALESLVIQSFDVLTQSPERMRSLTSLQELKIRECSGLHELPEWLGELRSLQSLGISFCENLREFPEGIQHLTSLQDLRINSCVTLRQLPEGLEGLLSLRSLSIQHLPKLSCLPEAMRGLTSLQHLHIMDCDSLHRLPECLGELRSLQKLQIWDLPALNCLPESMQRLTSLHHLWIWELPKLSCLPESMRGLTSLRSLEIESCEALHRLPEWLGELRSLQQLNINWLPALTCLPESMQRLTSLHHLHVAYCDALTVLPEWIGQLSALQRLEIWGCSGLKSLPSSIQRLAALEKLEIRRSPDLARRCKRGEGEDWHLISHIPHVSNASSPDTNDHALNSVDCYVGDTGPACHSLSRSRLSHSGGGKKPIDTELSVPSVKIWARSMLHLLVTEF